MLNFNARLLSLRATWSLSYDFELTLKFHLHINNELDERFDKINREININNIYSEIVTCSIPCCHNL